MREKRYIGEMEVHLVGGCVWGCRGGCLRQDEFSMSGSC